MACSDLNLGALSAFAPRDSISGIQSWSRYCVSRSGATDLLIQYGGEDIDTTPNGLGVTKSRYLVEKQECLIRIFHTDAGLRSWTTPCRSKMLCPFRCARQATLVASGRVLAKYCFILACVSLLLFQNVTILSGSSGLTRATQPRRGGIPRSST